MTSQFCSLFYYTSNSQNSGHLNNHAHLPVPFPKLSNLPAVLTSCAIDPFNTLKHASDALTANPTRYRLMHHLILTAIFMQQLGRYRIEIFSSCKKILDLTFRPSKSLRLLRLNPLISTSPLFKISRSPFSSHRSNSAKDRSPTVFL